MSRHLFYQALHRATLVAMVATGVAACGQSGPLELPESARPVQRIETPSAEPEQQDDEQQNER